MHGQNQQQENVRLMLSIHGMNKNSTWESLKTYLKTLKVAKDEDIDEIFDFWN